MHAATGPCALIARGAQPCPYRPAARSLWPAVGHRFFGARFEVWRGLSTCPVGLLHYPSRVQAPNPYAPSLGTWPVAALGSKGLSEGMDRMHCGRSETHKLTSASTARLACGGGVFRLWQRPHAGASLALGAGHEPATPPYDEAAAAELETVAASYCRLGLRF
jgi:hypothetical protein